MNLADKTFAVYASRQLLREDCNKISANLNVVSQNAILKGVKSAA